MSPFSTTPPWTKGAAASPLVKGEHTRVTDQFLSLHQISKSRLGQFLLDHDMESMQELNILIDRLVVG